jgi:hypothetical protein
MATRISTSHLSCYFHIESFLESLDYYAVRPLDLTVGSWVCNGDVFDFDACIFTELLELVSCEI